jgi:DNA invertase Pin-like site-specific DNA recombinase
MKAIAYLRVSSREQGASGLGLESQQAEIMKFCTDNKIELIEVVSEVASAKGYYKSRPKLDAALKRCKRERCAIIVSKLDRISRDVESIGNLTNDKSIRFIVVQLGIDADNFQIHLYASLAQKEREYISQRTKAALKAKKERGLLGTDLNRPVGNLDTVRKASILGSAAIKFEADSRVTNSHIELVADFRSKGYSMAKIADKFNALNMATAKGGMWHASTVCNLIKRIESLTVAPNGLPND